MLTPLHPLNVAYRLFCHEQIDGETIPEGLSERLNSVYLLPFFYNDEGALYEPVEQDHSPEWVYYVDSALPRYKGSRRHVSRLVQGKINDFIKHFSYLFDLGSNAPIKINLVNLGDCREVVQGLLAFYRDHIKGTGHTR